MKVTETKVWNWWVWERQNCVIVENEYDETDGLVRLWETKVSDLWKLQDKILRLLGVCDCREDVRLQYVVNESGWDESVRLVRLRETKLYDW
jgi:hypothetical protein